MCLPQIVNHVSVLRYSGNILASTELTGLKFTCQPQERLPSGLCPIPDGEAVIALYRFRPHQASERQPANRQRQLTECLQKTKEVVTPKHVLPRIIKYYHVWLCYACASVFVSVCLLACNPWRVALAGSGLTSWYVVGTMSAQAHRDMWVLFLLCVLYRIGAYALLEIFKGRHM